jgi:predicted dehydrogenase
MGKGLPLPTNRMVHFVDVVTKKNVKQVVRMEESLKLQRILDAVYESSKTGKEIRIK